MNPRASRSVRRANDESERVPLTVATDKGGVYVAYAPDERW
jgi:hypothetical protein